jgi:hypothetical protein
MTWRLLLGFVCQAAVIALAWAVCRRRREHRPIALFASAMLAVDIARLAIMTACPWIMNPGPFDGVARVIFHFDQGLFTSWPVAVAWMSWTVFLRRRPWPPLLAGALLDAALVLGYPDTFRSAVLGRAYAGIHGAMLFASLVAVVAWVRHRPPMRLEAGAALFILLIDLAYFAGPYALPDPWVEWAAADVISFFMWGGLLLIHAGALWDDFLMPVRSERDGVH